MNRTTALLVLGAILLIVANLLGEDGAVSRVASADKTEIAAAIDSAGDQATASGGFASEVGGDDQESEIVRPTVADDASDESDDASEFDNSFEDSADSSFESGSDQSSDEPFDPRIG